VPNILIRKPIALLKAEAEKTEVQALVTHGGVPLKRTLSAWSLVSLGIGCILGFEVGGGPGSKGLVGRFGHSALATIP
jgi:hypothetical protein